ncbi:MAG: EF-Tu/IF-2/RF-3 family GTPase [Nitrososphaerales archaeon]
MNGFIAGVFGTNLEEKGIFESSIAKKSEVEGIIVYHRNEQGLRYSFLDDAQYPEKIQGYSRIASLCDYAYYMFPRNGKLQIPDGELAVLLDCFGLGGEVLVDEENPTPEDSVRSNFKGLGLELFPITRRISKSSIIDLSRVKDRFSLDQEKTLIYIDRSFNVKGVGVVALGFILSGTVAVHDKLRITPSASSSTLAEVKGIQVSDEDFDSVGRGVRVGLSLKGIDVKDLAKAAWLDDGSLELSRVLKFEFNQSKFYKQKVADRDIHLQLPGELVLAKISQEEKVLRANLGFEVPCWEGMRIGLVDLNAKNLRLAGFGTVKA